MECSNNPISNIQDACIGVYDECPEWFKESIDFLLRLSGWKIQGVDFSYEKEINRHRFVPKNDTFENFSSTAYLKNGKINYRLRVYLFCIDGKPKHLQVRITFIESVIDLELKPGYFTRYKKYYNCKNLVTS